MCQKFESTYFLLKFPFHMKSYVTDSIFSPIRGCFDVAKVYFFSAILKKIFLLQKSTAPKITSTISEKLIENVFEIIICTDCLKFEIEEKKSMSLEFY